MWSRNQELVLEIFNVEWMIIFFFIKSIFLFTYDCRSPRYSWGLHTFKIHKAILHITIHLSWVYLRIIIFVTGSQLVQYKPSEDLPDLFDLANLSKEDEEALQNTVDVGDLNYFTKQDVPADDLD